MYDEESTRELAEAWVDMIREAQAAGLVFCMATGEYTTPEAARFLDEQRFVMQALRYQPVPYTMVITDGIVP
jgi:hypothetical protein